MRVYLSTVTAAPPAGAFNPGAGRAAARMVLEVLRTGQRVRCVVRGSSMWPAVRDGALVEITPCGAGQLIPGDLGAYAGDHHTLIVHRVVTVGPQGVGFAGDTLGRADGCIPRDRVLGRAAVVSQPRLHLRWPGAWHLRPLARRVMAWLRPRWLSTPWNP